MFAPCLVWVQHMFSRCSVSRVYFLPWAGPYARIGAGHPWAPRAVAVWPIADGHAFLARSWKRTRENLSQPSVELWVDVLDAVGDRAQVIDPDTTKRGSIGIAVSAAELGDAWVNFAYPMDHGTQA